MGDMPTISLDNTRLHYEDHRPEQTDRTVLLIHGAGGSRLAWPESIRRLAGARVVALDLPGHGRSAPPGRRTVAHYAQVVEAFVVALGLPTLVLAGHSMGSAIALTVAHRRAVSIEGLILLGVSARMPVSETLLRGSLASLDEVAGFVAEHGLADSLPEVQEFVRREIIQTGGTTLFGDYLACNRYDLRPVVGEIDKPALLIAGRHDSMVPLRFSESLAAGLPNADLRVLDRAGHFMIVEQPEAVVQLMESFLAQLANGRGAAHSAGGSDNA